jgi:hypothetical protein
MTRAREPTSRRTAARVLLLLPAKLASLYTGERTPFVMVATALAAMAAVTVLPFVLAARGVPAGNADEAIGTFASWPAVAIDLPPESPGVPLLGADDPHGVLGFLDRLQRGDFRVTASVAAGRFLRDFEAQHRLFDGLDLAQRRVWRSGPDWVVLEVRHVDPKHAAPVERSARLRVVRRSGDWKLESVRLTDA